MSRTQLHESYSFLSQDKEVADSTTNIHGWAVVFNDKVMKYKGDEL